MRRLFPVSYLPREKTFSLTDPGLLFIQSRAAVDKLQKFTSGGSLFLLPLYDGDAKWTQWTRFAVNLIHLF